MRVVWLDTAIEDLVAIRQYIAEHRPAAADRIAARIYEAAERLGEMPDRGRRERIPTTRELVIPGTPYVLPYRVQNETVQILRVYHGARRWPTRL